MLEVAGQASQTHYHSIAGEILPHLYIKNIFLAQKLKKLKHFKEIHENVIEKSLKIQKIKKKYLGSFGAWPLGTLRLTH